MTGSEFISEAKRKHGEISAQDAADRLGSQNLWILDVRETEETKNGFLPHAVFVPRGRLEVTIEKTIPSKESSILVYCAGGGRSALAVDTLKQMGYTKAVSLAGGFSKWESEGRPIEKPTVSMEHRGRYTRQMKLSEIGETGQKRLSSAKVLLIGAGGLGSPAAFYLAAAGVGTIGIADFDRVDESNLQRQILHGHSWLGESKVKSAIWKLRELNPNLDYRSHEIKVDENNVVEVISSYEIVIDGSDNLPTRYTVSDACRHQRKPYVYGSVHQFEGRVSLFHSDGPCFRCLFPRKDGYEPTSCEVTGVLGVLPGLVGTFQATEALRWILGFTKEPTKLLILNGLKNEIQQVIVKPRPDCSCSLL